LKSFLTSQGLSPVDCATALHTTPWKYFNCWSVL
jgi:hypothetical protein